MSSLKRKAVAFLYACFLPIASGTGCSTVKSWFPDKEKDYQFRTEIPELVLPKELEVRKKVEQPSTVPRIDLRQVYTPDTLRDENKVMQVQRVQSGDAVVLRINESLTRSWRIVGKALARQSIEIVARDRSLGLYIVQYDPDAAKVTDDSFWDEIKFIFGQYGSDEKEYRVRLIEHEDFTDVMVRDQKNQTVSSGDGLILLQTIQQSIETDLADQ